MSLSKGDGFILEFEVDEDTFNKVLRAKNLSATEIAALSLKLSPSNPKLKNLVSLFANLTDITKVITEDKIEYHSGSTPPLNLDLLTVKQSSTKRTETIMQESIWSKIGVKLIYNGKKVISMEGANYNSGRPVAPSVPASSPIITTSPKQNAIAAAQQLIDAAQKLTDEAATATATAKPGSKEATDAQRLTAEAADAMNKANDAMNKANAMTGAGRTRARPRRRKNKSYKKNSV